MGLSARTTKFKGFWIRIQVSLTPRNNNMLKLAGDTGNNKLFFNNGYEIELYIHRAFIYFPWRCLIFLRNVQEEVLSNFVLY